MNTLKKIVLIINHFGKFNNYFDLWLHTCKNNPSIDWIIFSDDNTPFKYPRNVKLFQSSFSETVKKFQSVFDFKIELRDPYRLCEFRVAYGEIYADLIREYDFWGYCDTDVIWGNLREHITSDILDNYSKISWRGHFTLYKNNKRINGLYRSEINGIKYYKYALSHKTGYPLAFDERAINNIFETYGEKIYNGLKFADLQIRNFNFFLLHFPKQSDYKNKHQVFLWDCGNLYRYYYFNSKIYKESFAYIHFLKRPMKLDRNFNIDENFLIIPNKFVNQREAISTKKIIVLSEKHFYWSYFFSRLNLKYFINKFRYHYGKRLLTKNFSFLKIAPIHFKISEEP